MPIPFTNLSPSTQKELFKSLCALEDAFSVLETTIEETFGTLEEVVTDLEEEVGEEHPLSELLCSLKAHIEEQTGSFDLTANFSPEEKTSFLEWFEEMKGA